MTEEIATQGRTLNATFLPASLLRKNQNKLATSLTSKYEFQKTTGNSFITIDPPEIKFAGYELDKSYTATVRIINRAPIPQRVVIIAPQTPAFCIKSNKKGSIASGMAENITVLFRSNEYKYQTDVVSIRTQTENFVIPLYAFPTLPDLRSIFPKVIDFGAVECREPATYQYPINNTVPLNFEFEFSYLKQSQQISINPLKGVIPAQQTLIVQITFMPTNKSTSTAEVLLYVRQFDFQPLPIKIIGSGAQSMARPVAKRIKSSKLAPLKEGQQSREANKTAHSRLKRRPSGQLQNKMDTNNQLSVTGNLNPGQLGVATLKKTHIRTVYPKLMSVRRTFAQEQPAKILNPAQIAEREYLNKFSRIHDLDKEKQIKFSQFLGDKAMTQPEIQFQKQLVAEIQKARLQALQKSCRQRINPEVTSSVAVEFKIVPQKTVTWDDKKNDQHHNRRQALVRFMNAGTKVILQYRMTKRLGKIKQLLSGCRGKNDVRKLVEESHAKAMDRQQGFLSQDCEFNFGLDSIRPSYFQLQFEENKQKQGSIVFQPEGKTSFDDLAEIKQIIPHNIDKLKFAEMPFPPDYYNHHSFIPSSRQSAEEEYFYKTSALPEIIPDQPTLAYGLPIKVSAHHFIYDDQKIKRYQNYITADEKDPEIYLDAEDKIEDQYEGWTGGDYDVLKYKFSRNLGCQYTSFSGFNNSSEKYPLPPLASLGQGLPKIIDGPSYQDTIQQGDSDQEDINEAPVEGVLKFLDQIEGKNADIKQRRSRKQVRNPEKGVHQMIQKNLQELKLKSVGEYVGRVKQANKWIETASNRLLL